MEPICLIARAHNVVSRCSTLRRRVQEAAFHAVDRHRLRIARRRRIARSCAAISRSKHRTRLRARAATFPRQRGPCLSPPIVAIARENSILCFCFSCPVHCLQTNTPVPSRTRQEQTTTTTVTTSRRAAGPRRCTPTTNPTDPQPKTPNGAVRGHPSASPPETRPPPSSQASPQRRRFTRRAARRRPERRRTPPARMRAAGRAARRRRGAVASGAGGRPARSAPNSVHRWR